MHYLNRLFIIWIYFYSSLVYMKGQHLLKQKIKTRQWLYFIFIESLVADCTKPVKLRCRKRADLQALNASPRNALIACRSALTAFTAGMR